MKRLINFIKTHKIIIVVALILGIMPNLMVTDYSNQYNEEVTKIKSIKEDTESLYDTDDMIDLRESINTLKDKNAKLDKEVQAKQAELDKLKNN